MRFIVIVLMCICGLTYTDDLSREDFECVLSSSAYVSMLEQKVANFEAKTEKSVAQTDKQAAKQDFVIRQERVCTDTGCTMKTVMFPMEYYDYGYLYERMKKTGEPFRVINSSDKEEILKAFNKACSENIKLAVTTSPKIKSGKIVNGYYVNEQPTSQGVIYYESPTSSGARMYFNGSSRCASCSRF